MKKNIIIIITIMAILLVILSGVLIKLWNTKISWVVCDKYEDYEDCYRVVVKFGDYFLNGEECYEEYEDLY